MPKISNIYKTEKSWYTKKQALFALAFHELIKEHENNKLRKSSNNHSLLYGINNIKYFRRQYPKFDEALTKVLYQLNFIAHTPKLKEQQINKMFKSIFPFNNSCLLHPIYHNYIIILGHTLVGKGKYGRVKETQIIKLVNIKGKLVIHIVKPSAASVVKIQSTKNVDVFRIANREISNLKQANREVYWQYVTNKRQTKLYLNIDKEQGIDGSDYILHTKYLTVQQLWEFYLEYLLEIQRLHQLNVVHLDGRLENLKFNAAAAPGKKIRLLDFGVSRQLNSQSQDISSPNFIVTKYHLKRETWVAPECYADYKGQHLVTVKADLYSIGWNMLHKIPQHLQQLPELAAFKKLAINMLAENPLDRPSVQECIEYIQNILATNNFLRIRMV